MGAGKTTIGRQLARRLNLDFFDSDREIEKAAGVDVATIFEFEGERSSLATSSTYFRNPRPNQLAICGDDNGVITMLEITELSGAGKRLGE